MIFRKDDMEDKNSWDEKLKIDAKKNREELHASAKSGDLEEVVRLTKYTQKKWLNARTLEAAMRGRHDQVAAHLVPFTQELPLKEGRHLLKDAVSYGLADTVKALLIYDGASDILDAAAHQKNPEVLNVLLSKHRPDPEKMSCFLTAMAMDNKMVVNAMLPLIQKHLSGDFGTRALVNAAHKDDPYFVRLLLPLVDPTKDQSSALSASLERNNPDIVQLLFSASRPEDALARFKKIPVNPYTARCIGILEGYMKVSEDKKALRDNMAPLIKDKTTPLKKM